MQTFLGAKSASTRQRKFCPVLCSLDILYNVQTRQHNSAGHFYRTDAGANDVTLYTLEFSTRMIFFLQGGSQ